MFAIRRGWLSYLKDGSVLNVRRLHLSACRPVVKAVDFKRFDNITETAAGTAWLPFERPDDGTDWDKIGEPVENGLARPTKKMLEDAVLNPRELMSAASHLPASHPLLHEDYFNVASYFTVRDLFEARVHFGHKIGTLNPKMKPYLFGERLGVCIFDLEQTKEMLKRALNFAAHIAFRDGIIMFVAADRPHIRLIEKTAAACGEFAHVRKWSGGTFTDSKKKFLAEIRMPDLVIFTKTMDNIFEQHPAIVEAAQLLIPTIGVTDSNCDPSLVSFPIPGNDDSHQCAALYLKLFQRAILAGKAARKKLTETESKTTQETPKKEQVKASESKKDSSETTPQKRVAPSEQKTRDQSKPKATQKQTKKQVSSPPPEKSEKSEKTTSPKTQQKKKQKQKKSEQVPSSSPASFDSSSAQMKPKSVKEPPKPKSEDKKDS